MGGQWLLLVSMLAAAAASGNDAPSIDSADAAADQSTADSNAGEVRKSSLIEEIIVTGIRDDTTLKDTAHSVVVFTEEQLRLGTDRQINDVLQRVPNVSTKSGLAGDRQPVIRGIAQNGIDSHLQNGTLPNNLTYVDGFFAPGEPSLWDTRQIEVQRGAENFVGGGVMGGLLATMTNDPGEATEGRLVASWAPDPDDRSLGIAYGGPLTDDLGYRFSAYARATDGLWTNPTRGDNDWNSSDETLARIKFVWEPYGDSDTVVRVRAEHHKNSTDGSNSTWTSDRGLDPFVREDFVDEPVHYQDETRSLNAEVEHRFDDRWSVNVQAGLIEEHLRGERDLGHDPDPGGSIVDPWRDLDYAGFQIRAFYDDDVWHAFFRQYVLYAQVTNTRTDTRYPDHLLHVFYPIPDWWFVGTQLGASRTFGRSTVAVSLLRSGQVLHGHIGGGVDGVTALDLETDLHDFNYLPTVTFDYSLADDWTIGAKYERSARLGGIGLNVVRGVYPYGDEFSDGYETFIRRSAFDGRLTLRTNVFYTRFADQQAAAQISENPDDVEIINAQRSHNDGVEIESTWTDGGLNLWLSVGLLQARFDYIVFPFDGDLSGNDFPNAPDWTVSFGCTYTRPSGLFVETDVTMRPETRANLENDPWVVNEARRIVNARVGWTFHQLDASVYARNLFDEHYLDFRDSNPVDRQVYSPGDPREVGMTLSLAL